MAVETARKPQSETNAAQIASALEQGERERRRGVWGRLMKRGWVEFGIGLALVGLGALTVAAVPWIGIPAFILGGAEVWLGSNGIINGSQLKSADRPPKK